MVHTRGVGGSSPPQATIHILGGRSVFLWCWLCFCGTDQNEPRTPTVSGAQTVFLRGCSGSPAPPIRRRRWGGQGSGGALAGGAGAGAPVASASAAPEGRVSRPIRGGRICLPPDKRSAVISADIVGRNGRCRFCGAGCGGWGRRASSCMTVLWLRLTTRLVRRWLTGDGGWALDHAPSAPVADG